MTAPASQDTGFLAGSPPDPVDPPRPRTRRRRRWTRRLPVWLRSPRAARSMLRAWWYGRTADDLRAAWVDAREAPGWVALGSILVFWVCSGFSWLPVAAAAVAWCALMVLTHWARWYTRRRIRRFARPLIGVLALLVLAVEAGPWAWPMTVGLWLVLAALTDTLRARHRTMAAVLASVSRATRVDPGELDVVDESWVQGATLESVDIAAPTAGTEDPGVRARIASAVAWSLRQDGRYSVTWPSPSEFHVQAAAFLPREVHERLWQDLPGILIAVTDAETANGHLDMVDAETSEVTATLPIALLDPAEERHLLVAGGTGGGKSNFLRGFIARSVRDGWFAGGAYLFDGKSGSDFLAFEGREGIHTVARNPDEWERGLTELVAHMRARYEQEADYERGHRDEEPDHPRYLVVIDEIQDIRQQLGKDVVDPLINTLAKQIRGSNGRLVVATQRPDSIDAIPGAAKDMLEYIICLGYVSPVGAREILGKDWRAAVDEYGSNTVPGRGVARVGGRLFRIQVPRLDRPRKNPAVEYLYPRKRGTYPETPQPAANVGRWSPPHNPPRPREPENAADNPQRNDDTLPEGIPVVNPAPAHQTPASSPRRRTV
ncbi:hypothetical protein MOQ72_37160 [Saccharopolyspora sp. K220]|uniref:FtsK/SpoIIIE domain-containing protein n=1 Tax=Saccharopolyspora soli TaxID=2926618 RepID=UPI001F57D806|nr:FtsK/SpoIIIE domain-containing protein [Saccharopolyspora soli]MCI2423062.1 hypothetical protein [Saccharopolyspora soli]